MTSGIMKVKVGGLVAEGVLFARRVRSILDQRDAAFARIDTECRARLKALIDDEEATTAGETASDATESVAS